MEFVIVTCEDQERTVFIDNQEQGLTGRRLSVPGGLHVFDLGVPLNYDPPFQEVPVGNTVHTEPMQIPFTLISAREAVRRKTARKRASAGAGKRAASKAGRKRAGTKKKVGTKKKAAKSTRRKPAAGRRTAKKNAKKNKKR